MAAGRTHTSSEVSQLVVLAISAGNTLSHWPCQGHELLKSETPPAQRQKLDALSCASADKLAFIRGSPHRIRAARAQAQPRWL